MKYRFKVTPGFPKALSRLSGEQKQSAKRAFAIFKADPFDPRLRTYKIHHLSSHFRKTIYAVRIEGDLRSIFYPEGADVVSVDIGTHAIYQK